MRQIYYVKKNHPTSNSVLYVNPSSQSRDEGGEELRLGLSHCFNDTPGDCVTPLRLESKRGGNVTGHCRKKREKREG